jgi:hypothetical protein
VTSTLRAFAGCGVVLAMFWASTPAYAATMKTTAAVPEPMTLALFGSGLVAVAKTMRNLRK